MNFSDFTSGGVEKEILSTSEPISYLNLHHILWEYQTTWPPSWEICMQFKKKQLEVDLEQQISKLGQEYIKAVYCHPAYLIYMQSTS